MCTDHMQKTLKKKKKHRLTEEMVPYIAHINITVSVITLHALIKMQIPLHFSEGHKRRASSMLSTGNTLLV